MPTEGEHPKGAGFGAGSPPGLYLRDELRQPRVAEQEPAPRGDAVGFILEFLGLQLRKILEAARTRGERRHRSVWELRGIPQCLPFPPCPYTWVLTISEWILATPLTAWEPTMQR